MTEIDFAQAELVIDRIAELSEALAAQAGVGGMETAGNVISYLATHPRDIEPFLRFGFFELPQDWIEQGNLTWHAQNGKVVRPEVARRARIIKRMERSVMKEARG